MITQIGFPTFFLTLSATEIKWPELIVILHKLSTGELLSLEEAMNMDVNDKTKLIRDDPVTTVRYIDNIFNQIMRLLENKDGPFGEHHVVDSFERREFQARGSVHTHNLLYCNHAPVYEKERPESVTECIAFIDKFITCGYDATNPNMSFQRHRHTKTCNKGRKNKKSCRFNFPVPPMLNTNILEPLDKELITETVRMNWNNIKEKINGYFETNTDIPFDTMLDELGISYDDYIYTVRSTITRPKVFLKRTTLEVAMNSYNPVILNILGSNIDIQFVLDPYSCASYMLNYVTKIDAGLSKLLHQAATDIEEGNTSIRERLRKVGNVFINSHVMGAQEAVYHVLGLPLTKCSRSSVFISTFPFELRTRMLKSKSELQQLDVDSEDIFLPSIFEKYSKRPSNLENICLADYAAKYARSSRIQKEDVNEDSDESVLKKRKKHKILRYRKYRFEQNPTDYYREQLLMFSPWRDELLEVEQVNHESKFKSLKQIIENNRQEYCSISDEVIDSALETAFNEDLENEEVANFESVSETMSSETQEVNLFDEGSTRNREKSKGRGQLSFTVPPSPDIECLFNTLLTLNKEQRQILMHVLHCLKNNSSPLRIYISGSAGVGKSTVISAIFNLMTKYYDERVGPKTDGIKILLAAPSGKAAFNIGGMTLHSAFLLPVTQYGGQMPELSNDVANTIRAQLQNMQLLIIDEVSMVGGRLLQRVDTRLRQIMGRNVSFGGVSVILVGDLNQLPPVLDTPIYLPLKTSELSILTENVLWEEFKCFQLVQIMRQRNDAAFITALNNLAAGTMTPEDVSLIKSREVDGDENVPVEAIRLFSLNKSVEQFNELKILNHPGQLYICPAKDHISGNMSDSRKTKILETLISKHTSQTGGLPKQISLKTGIKYMITSNVDVADGLVNGACGTLVYLSIGQPQQVDIVWIDFGSDKVGKKARSLQPPHINLPRTATPVHRISIPVTIGRNTEYHIVREQFPIVPAEAITIHKSQGQTYSSVCVNLAENSPFSKKRALIYVALSRVTSLENLYIVGSFIPPKAAELDNPLTSELHRLRGEKKLSLSFETNISNISSLTVIYQNTRSLMKYSQHIASDDWYSQGDLLVFSETRTLPSDTVTLPGYYLFHRTDGEFSCRSARGVMCFSHCNVVPEIVHLVQYNNDRLHIDLIVIKCNGIFVITGYRSPSSPTPLYYSLLEECLSFINSSCKLVLIGDFNMDTYNEESNFVATLESKYGIRRALPSRIPTTDFETQIDVVFCKNINTFSANTYETYFSDHKPVYINIPFED